MAEKRISDISTTITTVTDTAYMAFDNNDGTDKTEKITYLNLETQIRGGASDFDLARLDGITATNSELNILDGATLSTAELNVLDGFTGDASDLNKLDGFTGSASDIERLADVESDLMGKDENQAVHTGEITASGIITGGSGNYGATTSGSAILTTMPEITALKSEEILIYFRTDGGQNVTIVPFAGDGGFVMQDGSTTGTTITLDSVNDFVLLKSSSVPNGLWMIVGGYSYTLA
jgi:hypothetical protein